METDKEAKTTLIEIIESARRSNLSYTDFFLIFIESYNHKVRAQLNVRRDVVEDIVAKIRKLANIVARSRDTLINLSQRTLQLKSQGYQPFLVDCLGLPEVYEIYKRVTEACGVLSIAIEPYVNVTALTYSFRDAFRALSMPELAKILGTSLYRGIDLVMHNELSNPLELDTLVRLVDARLKVYADDLARDAINKHRTFIVSDHGYDNYHENNRYYLGHGEKPKLAKIAPLIIVNCDILIK